MNVPGRVLVVAPQPFYEDRGTPIAVLQLVEALADFGYETDVLTYPVGQDIDVPGVRVIRVGNPFRIRSVPIGLSLRKVVLDLSMIPPLRRLLRERRYYCVHAVEEAAFAAAVLARRVGVPVVYDMQSSLPEQLGGLAAFRPRPIQAMLRACERWLIRRVDLVISSKGLADRVRSLGPDVRVTEWAFFSEFRPVPAEEIEALRADLGIPAGARVIVYAGTFEEYQGLHTFMSAIERVTARFPDVVAVLVGAGGGGVQSLRRKAHDLDLGDNVRLVERRPRRQMPAYLAMADVLVSPRAFGGNLPLKVFDYLAAGRPIVATDIPTHRTILDDHCAVLVPPTAEALGGAIVSVLGDRRHAERLASAARRYAEERLGRQAFVQGIGATYQRLAEAAKR